MKINLFFLMIFQAKSPRKMALNCGYIPPHFEGVLWICFPIIRELDSSDMSEDCSKYGCIEVWAALNKPTNEARSAYSSFAVLSSSIRVFHKHICIFFRRLQFLHFPSLPFFCSYVISAYIIDNYITVGYCYDCMHGPGYWLFEP